MCPSSAEPTKNHCISSNCTPRRSSPTRKARGSNPPGRTKSSTLWGAALFVLHGFYRVVKEGIRTARAPRFASRGAETPRWGVSRARLGESLRAHQKAHCNVLLQRGFFIQPCGSNSFYRMSLTPKALVRIQLGALKDFDIICLGLFTVDCFFCEK